MQFSLFADSGSALINTKLGSLVKDTPMTFAKALSMTKCK
jgi:hypothetical protein